MDTSNKENSIRAAQVVPVLLEDELKSSFLDYAMSVVVSRAIPDVRDGLKPVHRRVLYAMSESGYWHNKPYHKSVRIVGDVLGKYHPHGDQAVYNTMVGMVQEFSKRYPLLDGQGNWGSIDGDNAAAMRYTEVRMQKIAAEILADLDKGTVEFVPNFDESTTEPVILPSRLPNLLINGTSGIAVGMATSIPPHNLGEVVDACLAMLDNKDITDDELIELVKAPDFPGGGIICGRGGIAKAYKTGRGNLILRSVLNVQETKKGHQIVVTELPYQVNKSDLIIKIADLVKDKIIEGITNIRDESNKKGIRVIIELRRNEIPEVVLNQLYKYTNLQTSVSILMLALLDKKPKVFTLRELIRQFLLHREEIIYRRTVYELNKARARSHILEGFITGLQNIDEVIKLIKASSNADAAIKELHGRFSLSLEQSRAILEMKLQRLTGLEQEKITEEMAEITKRIVGLQTIIDDKTILRGEIVKELQEIREKYADKRRSQIVGAIGSFSEADLIPDEEVVVTLTDKGYIKRVPLVTYGVQHRGGKGKMGMPALGDSEDIVKDVYVARNHDELLFFTNFGRVYSLSVYQVPEGSRTAKGRAIVNLLPLTEGERVVKLLCTRDMKGKSIVMLSKKGIIKRTDAMSFAKIRQTGIRAVGLRDEDELVFTRISSGNETIVIATSHGQGIRFKEEEVRQMGRQAAGVMGIRLKGDDYVVGMEVVSENGNDMLFATSRGYGKRVRINDFRIAHRGGVGVRTIPTDKRNGEVIGLCLVSSESNILLIDEAGKIIRLSPTEIRTMGRQARGVRLIKLDKKQLLNSVVAFEEGGDEDNSETPAPSGDTPTSDSPSESPSQDSPSQDSSSQDAVEEGSLEPTEEEIVVTDEVTVSGPEELDDSDSSTSE